MSNIKILSFKLDHKYLIKELNEQAQSFIDKNFLSNTLTFPDMLGIPACSFENIITQSKTSNSSHGFLILFNKKKTDDLYCYYLSIKHKDNNFNVKLVNWLNWITNMHESLELGYQVLFEQQELKDSLISRSTLNAFVGLYPLLLHMPQKAINTIPNLQFFEILRAFITKENTNYNKDYARNIYSQLKTSIREISGLAHPTISDIFKIKEIIKFKNNDICFRKTTLKDGEALVFNMQDKFLNNIMSLF